MKNLNEPMQNLDVYPSFPKYEEFDRRWSGDHCYKTHRFLYVKKGSFVLNIDAHTYIVREGQLAFLPANHPHTYWLSSTTPPQIYTFIFRAYSHGEDFFERFGFADDTHVVNIPKEDFDICIDNFHHSLLSDTALSQYIMKTAQQTILIGLYARARILMDNAKSEFHDVIEYMQAHITEDLSLTALAAKFHFNPSYFAAKFRRHMGVSPMRYFAQMRAQYAGDLLKTTDMSVHAIAAAVGFQDVYYFKTFFAKHMGVRPENFKGIFTRPPELRRTEL